jgi:hypothetical protein
MSEHVQEKIIIVLAHMRKGLVVQSLAAEILCFLLYTYYGTVIYITQIVHLNVHLNPLKCVFSDKPNCGYRKLSICNTNFV